MDFAAERIEGINYRTGKAITVIIKNGIIHDIQPGESGGMDWSGFGRPASERVSRDGLQ